MTEPVLEWIKQEPVFNTTGNDSTPSIAIDRNGNSYVAYCTAGTVSGGTFLGGACDIVVFKLDTNGNHLWSKQQSVFNTNGDDYWPGIAVDSNDNVYVTYYTSGTVSGGTKSGSADIVVFKLDTNGNHQWSRQQTVFNNNNASVLPSIAVDVNGNIYIAYQSYGTVSGGIFFGGLGTDIVVFKLDTNGNHLWNKQQPIFNTSGFDLIPSIDVDDKGNVYVAYMSEKTVSGGIKSGFYDIIVFKLNTNGVHQWSKQQPIFNTSGFNESPSLALDGNGNIYIAYASSGTVSGGTPSGSSDIIVFKLDTNGVHQWNKQQSVFNTNNFDADPSITVDNNGNVYITYYTFGTVSGGVSSGELDIVVFKLDTNGINKWSHQESILNTITNDQTPSIGIDNNGNVYISYVTYGTVSGGTLNGGSDIVVFKLGKQLKQDNTFKPIADCFSAYLGNEFIKIDSDMLVVIHGFIELLSQRICKMKKIKHNCKEIKEYKSLRYQLELIETLLILNTCNDPRVNARANELLQPIFNSVNGWYSSDPQYSKFTELIYRCNGVVKTWEPVITESIKDAILLVC
ncbi:NHl repeat unit of beta-propeller protein [Fadolivirus algeromassiliense]|uniref:NHl repeat unit of beta-propeller protein n=1 Tax=Fadolivirus FV1/VV64 TaxID=3070911 RepID=A0A7D3UVF0_9VIRU|nr:NHl repeat unit of beta-propeller protein [Fadolivirus algeromassiliense]QKF94771.1 NHl repeat unit of beta-propeller protein [Fadolivirus FV1/VV64]